MIVGHAARPRVLAAVPSIDDHDAVGVGRKIRKSCQRQEIFARIERLDPQTAFGEPRRIAEPPADPVQTRDVTPGGDGDDAAQGAQFVNEVGC